MAARVEFLAVRAATDTAETVIVSPVDGTSHHDTVRASFKRQLTLFSGPGSPFARRDSGALAWLEPLGADMRVLEVACGAAHVGEQVAGRVQIVVGVDLTRELLDLGSARLRDNGIANFVLMEGDAQRLPFVDEGFDLVCCRSSLHHFEDPVRAVAEMVRVCRRRGRVAISDLVAPSAEVRNRFDELHRLLDPSHQRAYLEAELAGVFPPGTDLTHAQTDALRLPLEIAVTGQSDREAVVAALRAELDGGPATGFDPSEDGGTLVVTFATCTVEGTVTFHPAPS